MVKDYYTILGVPRTASADEIKQAYRRAAAQHHPDRGGDTARFQDIQQAYDVLGDQNKKAHYDQPQHQGININFGTQGFDFSNIFDMFNQGFGPAQARRGHARMTLWISLKDAMLGGRRTVSLGTQQGVSAVDIEIPLGINDGDNVQYAGLAPGGADLVINFRVHADANWQRQGLNLITERRVVIWDLILGGSLKLQDLLGNDLVAQIPPGTQPGTMLRLRDRGLRNRHGQTGDVFVRVQTFLPGQIAAEIRDAIQNHRG